MEINMGTEHCGTSPKPLKRLLRVNAKTVSTTSLQALGRKLNMNQRLTFTRKYGNILGLLEVDVQVGAITALAQYYDAPLRCFTFQDFQLAPTVEEFGQILGLSLSENPKPYLYREQHTSIMTIANVLKIHPKELREAQLNRNHTPGFAREYLEKIMHHQAEKEDWETFMDTLALTIYGVILFPRIFDYVDFAAIDVFFALKFNSENPVTAILANVYCTMDYCHERKGKSILCCLPMLYVWLTSHVFNQTCKVDCPIADWRVLKLKTKDRSEWSEHLASLTGGKIRWYPQWMEVTTIVYQCGNYPNVPLIGTRGCINYNPALAQRQLAYPMLRPPAEELMSPLVIYYDDAECPETLQRCSETLRKIRNAWLKVIRRGKELGVRSHAVKESYYKWVVERAAKIKLPFKTPSVELLMEPSASSLNEDISFKEMQAKLLEMNEKNKKMEEELMEAHRVYAALRREKHEKERLLKAVYKRRKSELKHTFKVKQCLGAANKELKIRVKERDTALAVKGRLKDLLIRTKKSEKEALNQKISMQEKMNEMEQRVSDMTTACEEQINAEKWEVIRVMKEYQATIEEMSNRITQQDDVIVGWMRHFAKLAYLANGVIDDLPHHLRKAEVAMLPFGTPNEVRAFIEYCKEQIKEMKTMIAQAKSG